MGNVRDRINDINDEVKALEGEKMGLQNTCLHNERHVVDYSSRIGHVASAELCKECDKFIKYIKQ